MEKASRTINRSYMKIQDVGAKVGGIIKVIMDIFGLFNRFLSLHKLNTSFLSQLFDFNLKDTCDYNLLKEVIQIFLFDFI